MRRLTHILFLLVIALNAMAWEDTRPRTFNERVKSLQVILNGDAFATPVMVLGTGDEIVISFDHLADERVYLRYQLVHCNADWQPSQLVDTEFLDGFNEGVIEDYDYSQLTTTHYVHYWLSIPNADVAPRVSGNYLVRIYPEDDPEDTWLQCRFMVSEQSAPINATIDTRTDIDYNAAHQQLAVTVDTQNARVDDPFNDVTLVVRQNGRLDNEVTLRHPLRMQGRRVAVYEHVPELIFDAGNEYRRFETVSVVYPGMGVEHIVYSEPYYHMKLYEDAERASQSYLYDQTQHGRYFVREYNSAMSDIEADYVVVHFALDIDEVYDALVFIDGDLTNRRLDPEALMTYNRATGRYERAMLLKQGAYNYQYLVVPNGSTRGYTAPIEGDKYQTCNEYLICAYARNPGERYDRLIGVSQVILE